MSEEKPYLLAQENDPAYLELVKSLCQLLESGDENNITIALGIMQNGGVPPQAMTGLFMVTYFNTNEDLKKESKKLLMQNAPLPLLVKLQSSHIEINALKKSDLDLTKIARAWFHYDQYKVYSLWKYFTSEMRKEALQEMCYQNSLELKGFRFKKLPAELSDFSNLNGLDLGLNSLVDLPAFFNKFKKLEVLSLEQNAFTEFPLILTTLKSLKKLDLSKNPISTFPSEMKMMELEELHLNRVKLEAGTIEFIKNLLPKCKIVHSEPIDK